MNRIFHEMNDQSIRYHYAECEEMIGGRIFRDENQFLFFKNFLVLKNEREMIFNEDILFQFPNSSTLIGRP